MPCLDGVIVGHLRLDAPERGADLIREACGEKACEVVRSAFLLCRSHIHAGIEFILCSQRFEVVLYLFLRRLLSSKLLASLESSDLLPSHSKTTQQSR